MFLLSPEKVSLLSLLQGNMEQKCVHTMHRTYWATCSRLHGGSVQFYMNSCGEVARRGKAVPTPQTSGRSVCPSSPFWSDNGQTGLPLGLWGAPGSRPH